jgi:hypothetical protein
MAAIIGFVKVFEEEAHRHEFLDGSLHMGRLSSYKKIEDGIENNRADKFEGPSSWYQSGRITMKLIYKGKEISVEGLEGPVVGQDLKYDSYSVFCLYSIILEKQEYIDDEINGLFEEIKIDSGVFNLGQYPVVITQPGDFIERVSAAMPSHGVDPRRGSIKYFDEATYHGNFDGEHGIYSKRSSFAHQKEYRFSFLNDQGSEPYKMKVGNIRDIAVPCSVAEIERTIRQEIIKFEWPIS